MIVLAFLLFLLAAGVAGTVLALRDTIVDDARRVPTRPELVRVDRIR